jgi:hypothetical protein
MYSCSAREAPIQNRSFQVAFRYLIRPRDGAEVTCLSRLYCCIPAIAPPSGAYRKSTLHRRRFCTLAPLRTGTLASWHPARTPPDSWAYTFAPRSTATSLKHHQSQKLKHIHNEYDVARSLARCTAYLYRLVQTSLAASWCTASARASSSRRPLYYRKAVLPWCSNRTGAIDAIAVAFGRTRQKIGRIKRSEYPRRGIIHVTWTKGV